MLDPFFDGRSSITGAGGPALGFAPEQETLPEVALAYSSVLKAPQAPTAATFDQRWTAWGGAYGGGNKTSGDPAVLGSHDLTANTAGFAAGLDYRLTPIRSSAWRSRAAAPTGAWRRGWAAAGATRSRPASTAPRAGARPISPAPSPSPITGCQPTASPLLATISPRASTRRATAGASRAAIASPPSSAGSRLIPRSRRRASTRRATPRSTAAASDSDSLTMRAPAPIRAASWARASTA